MTENLSIIICAILALIQTIALFVIARSCYRDGYKFIAVTTVAIAVIGIIVFIMLPLGYIRSFY